MPFKFHLAFALAFVVLLAVLCAAFAVTVIMTMHKPQTLKTIFHDVWQVLPYAYGLTLALALVPMISRWWAHYLSANRVRPPETIVQLRRAVVGMMVLSTWLALSAISLFDMPADSLPDEMDWVGCAVTLVLLLSFVRHWLMWILAAITQIYVLVEYMSHYQQAFADTVPNVVAASYVIIALLWLRQIICFMLADTRRYYLSRGKAYQTSYPIPTSVSLARFFFWVWLLFCIFCLPWLFREATILTICLVMAFSVAAASLYGMHRWVSDPRYLYYLPMAALGVVSIGLTLVLPLPTEFRSLFYYVTACTLCTVALLGMRQDDPISFAD